MSKVLVSKGWKNGRKIFQGLEKYHKLVGEYDGGRDD